TTIRGGIEHDLAILHEKAGDKHRAQALSEQSISKFEAARSVDAQAQAIATASGILLRAGKPEDSKRLNTRLDLLRTTTNLNNVLRDTAVLEEHEDIGGGIGRLNLLQPGILLNVAPTLRNREFSSVVLNKEAPELMG